MCVLCQHAHGAGHKNGQRLQSCKLHLPTPPSYPPSLDNGVGGNVHAIVTLLTGELVVGGEFFLASGTVAKSVARWDGVSWHAISGGVNGDVFDLVVHPNGDLIAGGDFGKLLRRLGSTTRTATNIR